MTVKTMILYTVVSCSLIAALAALSGCGQGPSDGKGPVAVVAGQADASTTPDADQTKTGDQLTQSDLLHRRFILAQANGLSFTGQDKVPSLEFNEGFRISGAVCNRFTAQAELKDGLLLARQAASTKMLCMDERLNQLESDFFRLLQDGASLELHGKYLRLTGKAGDKPLQLEYELRDWVN
jgi:heat shock protein HslJ